MANRALSELDDQELNRRWAIATEIMQRHGLDALVLQNSNDYLGGFIRWFTGLPARWGYPRSLVFFGPHDTVLVEQGAFGGKRTPAENDILYKAIKEVRTAPGYTPVHFTKALDANIVADVLEERGARRIGWVNPAGAYFGFGTALEERLGNRVFVDVTDEIDQHKAIKSPFELAAIRATAALQDKVMLEVAEFVRPGVRDVEVHAYAKYRCQVYGAEQGLFLGSSSPSGEASLHRLPSMLGRTMDKGDMFAIVLESNGPGGFYTEIGRTISIGKPADELVKATQVAADLQSYVVEQIKPGVAYKDVHMAYCLAMDKLGLPRDLRLFSHGQGYDCVERPLVRDDEVMIVQENTNLACHPGPIDAKVNALVCDNFVVGAEGAEKIHTLSPDIIVV